MHARDVGEARINFVNSRLSPMGDKEWARFCAREWMCAECLGLLVKLEPRAVEPVGDMSMGRLWGDRELVPLLLAGYRVVALLGTIPFVCQLAWWWRSLREFLSEMDMLSESLQLWTLGKAVYGFQPLAGALGSKNWRSTWLMGVCIFLSDPCPDTMDNVGVWTLRAECMVEISLGVGVVVSRRLFGMLSCPWPGLANAAALWWPNPWAFGAWRGVMPTQLRLKLDRSGNKTRIP